MLVSLFSLSLLWQVNGEIAAQNSHHVSLMEFVTWFNLYWSPPIKSGIHSGLLHILVMFYYPYSTELKFKGFDKGNVFSGGQLYFSMNSNYIFNIICHRCMYLMIVLLSWAALRQSWIVHLLAHSQEPTKGGAASDWSTLRGFAAYTDHQDTGLEQLVKTQTQALSYEMQMSPKSCSL